MKRHFRRHLPEADTSQPRREGPPVKCSYRQPQAGADKMPLSSAPSGSVHQSTPAGRASCQGLRPTSTSRCAAHCKTIQQSKRPGPPTALRRAPPSSAEGGKSFLVAGWSCVTFLTLMSEREMHGVLHMSDNKVYTNCSAIFGYF